MPIYIWACKQCGREITCVRRVAEIEEGPNKPCPDCESTEFERQMCAPINRWRYMDE